MRYGVKWDEQPLGVESDAAIARRIGCRTTTVQHARTLRGIPCAPGPTVAFVDWDTWDYLLGWLSDRDIGRRLGCTRQSVSEVRTARGIPPRYPPGRRPSDEERSAYPGPMPERSRQSYEAHHGRAPDAEAVPCPC